MSTATVKCIACWWERQRGLDPAATVHETSDGGWYVQYGNGSRGPVTYGTLSDNPRMCLCGM